MDRPRVTRTALNLRRLDAKRRRVMPVNTLVVLDGDQPLTEMARTLCSSNALAGVLNGRQKHRGKNTDDRGHNEGLNQRQSATYIRATHIRAMHRPSWKNHARTLVKNRHVDANPMGEANG